MTTLAQALTTARRAKGLTQQQLADRAGVSQEAVSRYEHSRREPHPEALEKLADALGLTVEFLEGVDKVRGAWAIDAHLRRRATARATVWRSLEARLNMLRHHARYLYEEIDIRSEHLVPTFDPLFTKPEDAVRMVRMQWRMPIGPVRDLTAWVEGAGGLVVEDDFGNERVDGLSQWVDDHPIVLLNASRPTDRKRLTLAHELGHLCLHTQDIGEDVEAEANRFASEFLMPADVVKPQLRMVSLGKLLDLKRTWGVSMQALIERAYQLRTIDLKKRTSLYKQMSSRGWRKDEPGSSELAAEVPQLARQIGTALQERGLTAEDIAHLTGFKEPTTDNPFIPPPPSSRPLRLA